MLVRQSDGKENKNTLWRPGIRPGPRWGSLQRSRKPIAGGDWLAAPPKNPIPPLSGGLSYPTPKLVPTLLAILANHLASNDNLTRTNKRQNTYQRKLTK